jgi:asparagine synthase (glutamine-hydrolysing)
MTSSGHPTVIYHLDYPVAGPGAFPQFIVSRDARAHRKVVRGGQGGDELFGGYARYLVAYLEQCLKAALDGTLNNGNFVVSYESILPNLPTLSRYKPMLQEFWAEGLFEPMDRRYFRVSRQSCHKLGPARVLLAVKPSARSTTPTTSTASPLTG